MDRYDPAAQPDTFGLANTGALCHLNALLQAVVSNTAVVRAALANREYLGGTATGRALYDFVWAAAPGARPPGGGPYGPGHDVTAYSAVVLAALVADLRVRRPTVQYGPAQESASEGLVLLLDMLEWGAAPNPIAAVFGHRYRCTVYCSACEQQVGQETDVAVCAELFHFATLRAGPPQTAPEFSEAVRKYTTVLEDYTCDKCHTRGRAYRQYRLCMVSDVLVCQFNAYGPGRPAPYFPDRLAFPAVGGGGLAYRQTAQVEHYGSLDGGHYTARALRADGPYAFNDSLAVPAPMGPNPGVYLVFYHYDGPAAAPGRPEKPAPAC